MIQYIEKIINKIQNIFSISKFELFAVLVFFLGLLISSVFIYFTNEKENFNNIRTIENIIENMKQKDINIANSISNSTDNSELNPNEINSPDIENNSDNINNNSINNFYSNANDSIFTKKKKQTLSADTKININTDGKSRLTLLPGIGDKFATEIIKYRKISKFKNIEEIKKIKGIGKKKFEKIKNNITV